MPRHAKHAHRKAHSKDSDGATALLDRRDPSEDKDRRHPSAERPTSTKIQAYDASRGFDERNYDMRKGEIGNPAVPNPHPLAAAPAPGNQSTGLCVECAKGVAPGQNYVCRDHLRFS
jgi:hypothetical protein